MRRRRVPKRKIEKDPRYKSELITKMINSLMLNGKRSIAERILYNSLDTACQRVKGNNPLEVFEKAINNVRPLIEVKSRRVGGATYQVPIEVSVDRGTSLAMRWIRNFAKTRKGKPMEQKLADEIADAYKGEGTAVKKKEDTHKMAEANKAFSHYKW